MIENLKQTAAARYINAKDLRIMLGGISPATLFRMEKDGRIPRPKRLSRSLLLWNIAEVEAALNNPAFDREGAANNPSAGKFERGEK